MKRRILSLLVLLMVAVTGAWAERVIVTFSANGKSIVKENVTLPYTYWCHYAGEDGELDQIIRDLYDNIESGYCWDDPAPTYSGDHITAGMGDYSDPNATDYLLDVYITLGEGFRGSATVNCTYKRSFTYYNEVTEEWENDSEEVPVSLTITATPFIDITGVSLPATASLAAGGTTTLTATVAPDNATNKTVTWTTSDASVATVDANGVVTAMGTGTATITATATNGTADTSDDQSATCTVTTTYNGQFTINAGGDKVIFAQGNLQAVCASADADSNTPETFVWRFAEHQWDYIGGNYDGGSVKPTGNNFIDGNGSVSAAGTVDLFSWVGESSTLTGAAAYGLTNTWGHGSESGNGKNANEGLKADWGNLFGAGWHTPSKDEWNYLCNTRSTASGVRYAKAVVNSVPGVILLPDDWSTSYYALKSTNVASVGFATNTITATATNGTVDTSDDFSATCTVNVTVPAITLADDTDNSTTLTKWDGYEADVTLTRTLSAGSWNTFAVPFAISSTDMTTLGITAKQLVSSTFADGALTLNFADASSIEAGKPYLVKVAAALNLGSIVFDAVEVSSTAVNTVTGAVDFIPTFGK